MEVDTNCLYDNDHIEFLIEFMTLPAKRQSRYLRLVQLLFFQIETETSRIPSSFVFVAGGKSSDDKDGKFC